MLKNESFLNQNQGNDHYKFAAKIFKLAGGEEALEGETIKETNENFEKATRDLCSELTVSGVLQYDKEKGEQVLKPFSDLDGESSISILKLAGIKIDNVNYVRPGEHKEGSINLDTGDRFGVEYDEDTSTLFLDHHAKGNSEKTSTAAIVYKTLDKLGLFKDIYRKDEKLKPALNKLVDFVTKIDNRQYPPEEFLKSAKTVLGLQRSVNFDRLLEYFKDHDSPTEELEADNFENYGLKEAALKQQAVIDESMDTMEKMEKDGKFFNSIFGSILINQNNELKIGASAAYLRHDGIINFTPGKSFAFTLKNNSFDELFLKKSLKEKFQGKIIRGQMWIYNEQEPLKLQLQDLIEATKSSGNAGKFNGENISYYNSMEEVPEYCQSCHQIGGYCGNCDGAFFKIIKSNEIIDKNGNKTEGYFYKQ